MNANRPVVALSGGIGGAKLALGLLHTLPPDTLTIVANTGDDFDHLGLAVSPDIDTLLYTLSGRDDRERGWGRADETWHFMDALAEIGAATWFRLGDRDLAVHVERTRRLRANETLSTVTAHFAARFGIAASILPMSNDPVRTCLRTVEGWMDFQPWFVGERAQPTVSDIRFEGAATARLPRAIADRIADPDLRAIIICPSNPLISIGPILSVPGMQAALQGSAAPIVAVSPFIGGRAVKGPAAKMWRDRGVEPGPEAIAKHYEGLIDGLVVDECDCGSIGQLNGLATTTLPTLMTTLDDRKRVAAAALALADAIAEARP
jgi:LPPG:FO 2-phospho-L-lactate transferase